MKTYYVYILASHSRVLYIGVTHHLPSRLFQHQTASVASFTKRYKIDKLVYYEPFHQIEDALAREKQLKGWNRAKKIALIEKVNREWNDLSKLAVP